MMELEERIFHDASAAAAEITPADIPQLQLTGVEGQSAGRRSRHLTGSRARSAGRPARRILTPVAAAASVIALIAIVVVVGQGSSGPAHPRSSRPLNPAAGTGPSRAGALLATEALDWYFPASGATYTKGLAFAWRQDKITAKDIDGCLAGGGFPQPAFRGSEQLYQMSFPSSQFPDLAELAAHPGQHYFTSQYLVARNPTTARMNAMDRLQARCTARYAQAVTRVNNAAGSLQNAWMTIVGHIQNSRPVRATQPALTRCLEAHGVPARFATQTSRAPDPLFAGFSAWGDWLIQTATTARQQSADERLEGRVFLACAPGVVRVVEPIQLARRAQFLREHAAQVARITRLARQMGA